MYFLLILAIVIVLYLLGPRPRLDSRPLTTRVPRDLGGHFLDEWLIEQEKQVENLTPGAEACIEWHDGKTSKTGLCFLYLHGFSACRQETAPLTSRIAREFEANAVHARLTGHGHTRGGMTATAEDWLQSAVDAMEIASRIGDRVVIMATSTGAPIAQWLNQLPQYRDRVHALLLMSPNFKVNSPIGFLLTSPWATHWIPRVIGKERSWEPENDQVAKYWAHRYPVESLIEMQKMLDWANGMDISIETTPLATMYMKNDPTIDSRAAVSHHQRWGSQHKQLIKVTIDEEEVIHVFVGDINAPHRTDWCVAQFAAFLRSLGGIQHG